MWEKLITIAPVIKCDSYYKRCKRDCVSLVVGVLLPIPVLFMWGYFHLFDVIFISLHFGLLWYSFLDFFMNFVFDIAALLFCCVMFHLDVLKL